VARIIKRPLKATIIGLVLRTIEGLTEGNLVMGPSHQICKAHRQTFGRPWAAAKAHSGSQDNLSELRTYHPGM
jgi:hypothetical protein